jgi:dTDP-4-dehydrorhamnose reductase
MILITGENGYLGKAFIRFFKYMRPIGKNYITYGEYLKKPCPKKLTKIIHIAGVSDKKDFKNIERTTESMILLTQNLINISKEYNLDFIFFSSEAAIKDLDIYGTYKRAMEFYTKAFLKNYKILRIPRIYSSDREKGLIKQLKNNEVPKKDYLNKVEFLDLDNLVPQLYHYIFKETSNRIYYFKNLETKTILEIKDRYVN